MTFPTDRSVAPRRTPRIVCQISKPPKGDLSIQRTLAIWTTRRQPNVLDPSCRSEELSQRTIPKKHSEEPSRKMCNPGSPASQDTRCRSDCSAVRLVTHGLAPGVSQGLPSNPPTETARKLPPSVWPIPLRQSEDPHFDTLAPHLNARKRPVAVAGPVVRPKTRRPFQLTRPSKDDLVVRSFPERASPKAVSKGRDPEIPSTKTIPKER
jgi:hypothetical protein